jgi:predicted TIM-barrel fold metal-dependent hydrolase
VFRILLKEYFIMKIDVFTHILPKKYRDGVEKKFIAPDSERSTVESRNQAIVDLDVRFRVMDRYPGVLHVVTVALPPLEVTVKPRDAVYLAKIANDELAELCVKYPDRFIGAAACLPLSNIDATMKEIDRAVIDLKLKGIQMLSNNNGDTLDNPKFKPIYEKMVHYDLPIWIHPWSGKERGEPVFGWPYDTADAMLKLVAAGTFNEFPDLKIITHHCGSMISFYQYRIQWMLPERLGPGVINDPLAHFKKLYNDTAVYGNTPALMCAYSFFGAEHILFGTDAPLGPQYGLTAQTIASIERMNITDDEREKIFLQNAVKLLKIAI